MFDLTDFFSKHTVYPFLLMLAVSVLSSSSPGEPTDSPPILVSFGVYLRHAPKDTVLFRDFSSILFKVQFGFYHAENHLQDIAPPLIRNLRTINAKLEFLHTALTNQIPVHRTPPKLAQQSESNPTYNRPSHPFYFQPYSYWYPNSTSTTMAVPPNSTGNELFPLSTSTPTTTTTTSSPQWVSWEEQSEDSSPFPTTTRRITQSTIFDSSEEANFRGRRATSFNIKPKRQLFLGGMVVEYAAFKLFSYFDKTPVDQASMYESDSVKLGLSPQFMIQFLFSIGESRHFNTNHIIYLRNSNMGNYASFFSSQSLTRSRFER
jgi:hypothetical protein